VKSPEDGSWRLYIASKSVDQKGGQMSTVR
jgi:hypothetical protein